MFFLLCELQVIENLVGSVPTMFMCVCVCVCVCVVYMYLCVCVYAVGSEVCAVLYLDNKELEQTKWISTNKAWEQQLRIDLDKVGLVATFTHMYNVMHAYMYIHIYICTLYV